MMARIKIYIHASIGKYLEKCGMSNSAAGNIKRSICMENSSTVPQKAKRRITVGGPITSLLGTYSQRTETGTWMNTYTWTLIAGLPTNRKVETTWMSTEW